MRPDVEAVTQLIRTVAAEVILPRFRRLDSSERWEKRPGSWVTVADTAAEERLAAGLSMIAPDAGVLGEEAVEDDPSLLEMLKGDGPMWVIDPIDGTSNFAEGKERFAIIVAYVEGGAARAGWIHDPNRDLTVVAEEGGGAWLEGTRVRVAPPADHDEMTVSLGGRLRRDRKLSDRFAQVTNTKCCAMDYIALARGEVHAAHYRNLKPWDHAAGHLIHGEAGGYSACVDGSVYRPGSWTKGGLALAPDRDSWETFASQVRAALSRLD